MLCATKHKCISGLWEESEMILQVWFMELSLLRCIFFFFLPPIGSGLSSTHQLPVTANHSRQERSEVRPSHLIYRRCLCDWRINEKWGKKPPPVLIDLLPNNCCWTAVLKGQTQSQEHPLTLQLFMPIKMSLGVLVVSVSGWDTRHQCFVIKNKNPPTAMEHAAVMQN